MPAPSTAELVARAKALFAASFPGETPTIAVAAPGRINIIGEHVDYSGGFVFPMAIERETVIVGQPLVGGASSPVAIVATDSDAVSADTRIVEFSLTGLARGQPKWANYVKGVIANFNFPAGAPVSFRAAICSSVPLGAGLSSSAALEVATYTFLEALTNNGKARDESTFVEKAKACQKAEHDFANVPCGIMDQFISALGHKDHALLIDCKDNTARQIPLTNHNVQILVTDTHVKHSLDGSEYATRRAQCETALAAIQAQFAGVPFLGVATMDQLNAVKDKIDPVVYRRAHHAIAECKRTLDAADAFTANNYELAGKLMVESHNSLRDDYEVSCPELDTLVKLAMECKGVYGARMTGGGFGGCTVTLLETSAVDSVIAHLKQGYPKAESFSTGPAAGARVVSL
ncbi:galactokinase 1 [Capsaspora owczarzaki ATCC 30864]|uniref:Galactokinase 1 n=1 Tax=Capsaspora owczarzaki (strain ATCC 30864) TaxID=595528 RepID=A0A0D2U2Z0_CAPO3|nr:galactokinase 1 [Capsaspora owczarzaki ATCC 30864]KJE89546.1 galactokinase 1 [Capsaspora owczarzaki ATCC 30864]|eukprot:XP_004365866.1 galactokinase 1 [Capsaspora owczarzaki ATCC 30864]